ncbi:Mannosyl-oligosaccharide 1,2-alpha-mannosidase IA, partial [Rhizophlyctis rosea]
MISLILASIYYATVPWKVLWKLQEDAETLRHRHSPTPLATVNNVVGSGTQPLMLDPFLGRDRGHEDRDKMEFVKKMMMHAWDSYTTYASPADELHPIARKPKNWYDPHTLLSTPIDALDTLFIMNLTSRYTAAKSLVLSSLNLNLNTSINVFETTIRILGGLLSAYELEGDERLLERATELGRKFVNGGVFETRTGFALNYLNLASGVALDSGGSAMTANLAEMGTLQLEMQYLSDLTGDGVFAQKALFIYEQLHAMNRTFKGLYPSDYAADNLEVTSEKYGIGAGADSFYEYLLKIWLATGEERYRDWYIDAANDIANHLVNVSEDGANYFVPDTYYWQSVGLNPGTHFHHLTCFAGGMLSLGALTHRHANWTVHLDLGRRITDTCVRAYISTPTGLAGETSVGTNLTRPGDGNYAQRPELVESLFYMWRLTHDPYWREAGWKIVQSIEKWCRGEGGYHGLKSVWYTELEPNDTQESFFLAETLKYLYLLFASDDLIPLEKYVFNTEAHPLSVRGHGKRSDPSRWVRIPKDGEWYRPVGEVRDLTEEWVLRRERGVNERRAELQERSRKEAEEIQRRFEEGRKEEEQRLEEIERERRMKEREERVRGVGGGGGREEDERKKERDRIMKEREDRMRGVYEKKVAAEGG